MKDAILTLVVYVPLPDRKYRNHVYSVDWAGHTATCKSSTEAENVIREEHLNIVTRQTEVYWEDDILSHRESGIRSAMIPFWKEW